MLAGVMRVVCLVAPVLFVAATGTKQSVPPRPPDGTYVYRLSQLGTEVGRSTVTISSTAAAVTVKETVRIDPISAVASTQHDPQTLIETAYSADFNLLKGAQHTAVSIQRGVAMVRVDPGQGADIKADPSGPLLLLADNLVGTNVLIPATLHAVGAKAYTIAVLAGARTVVAKVVAGPSTARPDSVPSGDRSLLVDANGLRVTYWYDPRSYRLDEMDVPSQNFSVQLVTKNSAVQVIGTPQPAVTPVPTPQPHFASQDVNFTSADGTKLAGTLTIPEKSTGPMPGVVLVHGSGAVDRNEAVGPNLVFLQLSNALSNAGYAVLRFDKRGVAQSGGTSDATRDQLLADVRAAVAWIREQPSVNASRVYLLGHSEGGELVPTVAAADPSVAGIILMAPPALRLSQVITEQAVESVAPNRAHTTAQKERRALMDILAGRSKPPGYRWLRSSLDIDPVADLRRVHSSILILQGERDVQVLAKDLPRLVTAARATNHDVTVRVFSGDNHLFMPITSGEPATPLAALHQYLSVADWIDPRVLDALLEWLNTRSKLHPR